MARCQEMLTTQTNQGHCPNFRHAWTTAADL